MMLKVDKSEWLKYICRLDRASLLTLLVGGFREVDMLELKVSKSGGVLIRTDKTHYTLNLVGGINE